jgi:hypothetical protein
VTAPKQTDTPAAVPLVEAAQRARLNPQTVRSDVIRGRLRGFQLANGRWQIDAADLERYITLQNVERTQQEPDAA